MNGNTYSLMMEKKLIETFQMDFYEKMGYFPFVITRSKPEYQEYELFMTLEELEKKISVFLPKYGGGITKLRARTRKKEIVELRQMFTFMARKLGYTYMSIANYLGHNHTTVLHSFSTFKDLYETCAEYRSKYECISNTINLNPKIEYDSSVMDIPHQTQGESEPPVFS